jgi:WD40 repeat protein
MLAAGGDDNCVRVVDITAENEVKHEVRDLVAPVRSLAYDPKGDYLAVSLANGTVIILDLAMDCALAATLTKVAPPADVKQLTNNSAVWTPNGAYLAVPDKVRGVNLFNR